MTRRKLVLSTGNINKIEEIKKILKDLPIEVLSKRDLGLDGFKIEENGEILEENAIKKATSLIERVQGMVMADDTGLFVEYLNGEPGIHSARYSGINATYESNNIELLKKLKGVPLEKRKAWFKTVIALVTEEGKIITVSGECRGYISFEPKGEDGFGYDPLFIVEGYNKTFAELGEGIKNQISHRARALQKTKD